MEDAFSHIWFFLNGVKKKIILWDCGFANICKTISEW
jgi:hypothetical protein